MLILYIISGCLAMCTIPHLVEQNASPLWLVVIFSPIINTVYVLYMLYAYIRNWPKVKKQVTIIKWVKEEFEKLQNF